MKEPSKMLTDAPVAAAPPRFCARIVSGGQTGADRAALDFAIRLHYPHGGFAPHGRLAEDGRIPEQYQLVELPEGGYRQRTRRNVLESDGTLIVNIGALDGGTLATQKFAVKLKRPHLLVQLDSESVPEAAARLLAWLDEHAIKPLNVAGPRESKRPGIHHLTEELLHAAHRLCGGANTIPIANVIECRRMLPATY